MVYHNEVIKMLNDFNVSLTSELKVKVKKNRLPITRNMTGILNGSRFIYAKSLAEDKFLPRTATATCAGLAVLSITMVYRLQSASHFAQFEGKISISQKTAQTKKEVCKSECHMPGDHECKFFSQEKNP